MKTIIQKYDCKFINNLDSLSSKYNIQYQEINKNIYKIDQTEKPSTYIFTSDIMGAEELHFCKAYGKKKNIIIYQHKTSKIKDTIDGIIYLVDAQLPTLYNPYRFTNLNNKSRNIKQCYFLDNNTDVPEGIQKIIHPHDNNYRVKMFNNSSIEHPQNLGFLTEDDKAIILNDTQEYICENNYYAVEAHISGCKVLNMELEPIDISVDKYQTYENYMKGFLK